MNIGIDIDDTMTNTAEMLIAYGQKYDIEELKRDGHIKNDKGYFWHNEVFDWSKEEWHGFIEKYIEYIFENASPKIFMKEVFDLLKQDGHNIIIITTRGLEGVNALKVCKSLFEENNIKYDKLINNSHDKLKECIENNIDLFIDDRIESCKAVSEAGINTFIMNTPNNNEADIGNVQRVYSWIEIYHKIKQL